MPAEHFRPDGTLMQGYFCGTCGQPGISLWSPLHGRLRDECTPNPALVEQLREANSGKIASQPEAYIDLCDAEPDVPFLAISPELFATLPEDVQKRLLEPPK